MSTTTMKRVRLTLTDDRVPEDQQREREYVIEMPADYDPDAVTWEDVMQDGAMRIVPEDEGTRAESWLDEHGHTDSGQWGGIEGDLRDASSGNSDDPGAPQACGWYVMADEDDVERAGNRFPGYVWPDGSGVYFTDGYWDTISEGRAGRGGRVVGPT